MEKEINMQFCNRLFLVLSLVLSTFLLGACHLTGKGQSHFTKAWNTQTAPDRNVHQSKFEFIFSSHHLSPCDQVFHTAETRLQLKLNHLGPCQTYHRSNITYNRPSASPLFPKKLFQLKKKRKAHHLPPNKKNFKPSWASRQIQDLWFSQQQFSQCFWWTPLFRSHLCQLQKKKSHSLLVIFLFLFSCMFYGKIWNPAPARLFHMSFADAPNTPAAALRVNLFQRTWNMSPPKKVKLPRTPAISTWILTAHPSKIFASWWIHPFCKIFVKLDHLPR